ncbi:unnamed protein product [Calicophoron daubneyi]|uniref:TLC domain-containing protein n=1 Tax=Calicophoron daubneyi TaxID=300641 RepID=A0AAV2TX32_CALDB
MSCSVTGLKQNDYLLWTFAGTFSSFLISEIVTPSLSEKHFKEYGQLKRGQCLEWRARWMSTVHAVLVCLICIYSLIFSAALQEDKLFGTDFLSEVTLCISCGYMIYDMITMPMYSSGKGLFTYVVHHGVVILGYYYILHRGIGKFYVLLKLLTELSTPLINIRWILRAMKVPSNDLRVAACTVAFGVVFVSIRVFASIPFWISFQGTLNRQNGRDNHDLIREASIVFYILGITLDVLNITWTIVIWFLFRRALRDLTNCTRGKSNGPCTQENNANEKSS